MKNSRAKKVKANMDLPLDNFENLELVFGFVGPTGVDLDLVCNILKAELDSVKYETRVITLSKIIEGFSEIKANNYYERITQLIESGNSLREKTKRNEIIAAMAITAIQDERSKARGKRIAYLVKSFKRVEEVELFREIYGKTFVLVSVYSPKKDRLMNLEKKCLNCQDQDHTAAELASKLERRDQKEEGVKYGQRVRMVFPLADYFVALENRAHLIEQLKRLVKLTFGDPYISPTKEEEGMFFAQAAGLRSLDLSRQVGAVIASKKGELLTTGCNDVPKFGGGLYWGEDPNSMRDYEKGFDSNEKIKNEIFEELISKLKASNLLKDDKVCNESAIRDLLTDTTIKDSKLFDIIEFGRMIHAEMAAITQAAKNGISIEGARLFTTTFPCHMCSRHIISSGIREVFFIEPYEKSRTNELYSDSITIEPQDTVENKISFKAFVGVAPRKYMDFFKLSTKRKNDKGDVINPADFPYDPRIKKRYPTYHLVEAQVIRDLDDWLKEANKGGTE